MKNTTAAEKVAIIIVTVMHWFFSALMIWWGWSVLAPHLNAPIFTYWQIFAMRMALTYIMQIVWQKNNNLNDDKEK